MTAIPTTLMQVQILTTWWPDTFGTALAIVMEMYTMTIKALLESMVSNPALMGRGTLYLELTQHQHC
ncbi:MAG: hypothetical protein WA364_04105 [Candidatus Nitrosopolaris sp.]